MNDAVQRHGNSPQTCSIIGSFRRHYELATSAGREFTKTGVELLSPRDSTILDPSEFFVRLETDAPEHSAPQIQLIALHRILRSDFVFVICPGGYVGRTTAYEIGFVIARKVPLFFSEKPHDLPIPLADSSIISVAELCDRLRRGLGLPDTKPVAGSARLNHLHEKLLAGSYLLEEELR